MAIQTQPWDPTARREVDSEGFTQKQRDMQNARNPQNANVQNNVEPKEPPATPPKVSQEQRAKEQGQEPKKQLQQQQQAAQQMAPMQEKVNQIASQLGNFGYMLQNKVNEFMSQSASNIGMQQTAVKYDANGNVLVPGTSTADYNPVVAEKLAQQQGIRQTLNPFVKQIAGKLYAKDFSEVAKEQLGDTPETRQLLGILSQMNALDAQGYSTSPEYKSLQKTLEMLDATGNVTGLLQARDTYNRMMGLGTKEQTKWYGDQGGKGYSVLDVAQLTKDTIDSEVKKAATLSSGLFSGNFQSNLQRMFDTASAEAQRSDLRTQLVNRGLSTAVQRWVQDVSSGVTANKEAYDAAIKDAAKQVLEALRASGNTDEAQAWIEAVNGGKDIGTVMLERLDDPESGLAPAQRAQLTKYLGEIGKKTGGEFAKWIEDMGKTGTFTVEGKKITPTYEQKRELMDIMDQPDSAIEYNGLKGNAAITAFAQERGVSVEEAKSNLRDTALQKAFGKIAVDHSHNLSQHIADIVKSTAMPETLPAQIHALTGAMVASASSFAGSQVARAVSKALGMTDGQWQTLSPANRAAAMQQALAKDPGLLKNLSSSVNANLSTLDTMFQQDVETKVKTINDKLVEADKVAADLTESKAKLSAAPQQIASQVLQTVEHGMNVYGMEDATQAIYSSPAIQQLESQMYLSEYTKYKFIRVARNIDVLNYLKQNLPTQLLSQLSIPDTPDVGRILTQYQSVVNEHRGNPDREAVRKKAIADSGIESTSAALDNFILNLSLSSGPLVDSLANMMTNAAAQKKALPQGATLPGFNTPAWNNVLDQVNKAGDQVASLNKQLAELGKQKEMLTNASNTLQQLPTAMDKSAWGQLDPNQLIKDAIQGKSTTYRKARLLSDLTSEDILGAGVMNVAKPGATPGEPTRIAIGDLQGRAAGSLEGIQAVSALEPVVEEPVIDQPWTDRDTGGDVRAEHDWSDSEREGAERGYNETDIGQSDMISEPGAWSQEGYEGTPMGRGWEQDYGEESDQN